MTLPTTPIIYLYLERRALTRRQNQNCGNTNDAGSMNKLSWAFVIVVIVAVGTIVIRGPVAPAPKPVLVQLPPLQTPTHPVAAVAPPTPVLPPLPTVQVAEVPEHAVPPLPGVDHPFGAHDSQQEDLSIPDTSPSYRSLAPEYRPIPYSAAPAVSDYISGPARVTGATSLLVGGVPVELYGIKRLRPGSQCGAGVDCAAAAEQALESRVTGGTKITCHRARPSLGVVAFADCLDSQGTDLGGVLAGAGLVMANPHETYAYAGAENVARDLKKGYWGAH